MSDDRAMAEDLPALLVTIAEAADVETALLIARTHGGTRVTMPMAPGRNWLTALVGIEKARAIIERLGGAQRLDIPLGPGGSSYVRARDTLSLTTGRRIAELEAAGKSPAQISRIVGITERALRKRRTLARRRREQQPDLFERH